MSLLQINMFCSKIERVDFSQLIYSEINKVTRKNDIILYIHIDEEIILARWKEFLGKNKPDFKVGLVIYPTKNYLNKVYNAQQTQCKYSCKLDDDALISSHVWDYIIDNLDQITPEAPVMAPIFTNGIPSVELFIEDFLDYSDKQIAYKLLLEGRVNPNEWGVDFSGVNKKVESMGHWNGRLFWDFMATLDTSWDKRPVPWHYYHVRGVHPARYSEEYNMFIADRIITNKQKFFRKQDYYLDTYNAPYFTNNIFISETQYWIKTLRLFDDGFDEGQLTLQRDIDDSKILYIRNGFGIHMAYGMTANQQRIQQHYTKHLCNI